MRAAKLNEGDEVDVYVDDEGRVIAEHSRVYESGEALFDDLKHEHDSPVYAETARRLRAAGRKEDSVIGSG